MHGMDLPLLWYLNWQSLDPKIFLHKNFYSPNRTCWLNSRSTWHNAQAHASFRSMPKELRVFAVVDLLYLKLQPYRMVAFGLRGFLNLHMKFYKPSRIIHKLGKLHTDYNFLKEWTYIECSMWVDWNNTWVQKLFHVQIFNIADGTIRTHPALVLERRHVPHNNLPAVQWYIHWKNYHPGKPHGKTQTSSSTRFLELCRSIVFSKRRITPSRCICRSCDFYFLRTINLFISSRYDAWWSQCGLKQEANDHHSTEFTAAKLVVMVDYANLLGVVIQFCMKTHIEVVILRWSDDCNLLGLLIVCLNWWPNTLYGALLSTVRLEAKGSTPSVL